MNRKPILALTELVPGLCIWRRASNGGIALFRDGDGAQGLLLIDTGADDGATRGLLEWIDHFAASRVVIVNTHHHRDHAWSNDALLARGAQLLAGPGAAQEPGHKTDHRLNDLLVECLALPGHTPDSRAVIVRGAAFAGDAVYTPDILRRMPIPAYLDVALALESLDVLEAWLTDPAADPAPAAKRWLVPGHGRALQGADAAAAVAATRSAAEAALAALDEILGPPGYGPAPAPTDDQVRQWLEATGTAAQHAAAFGTWRRVAGAYARELALRRGVSAL